MAQVPFWNPVMCLVNLPRPVLKQADRLSRAMCIQVAACHLATHVPAHLHGMYTG